MPCVPSSFRPTQLCAVLTLFAASLIAQSATQVGQLHASDLSNRENFGTSTVISLDGSTIAVGAVGTSEIYVYQKPASGWGNLIQTAILNGGPCIGGANLAISANGGTIITGGGICNGGGYTGYGFLDVFVRPAAGWQNASAPNAILTAPRSPQGFNQAGFTFAMSPDGGTIAATGQVGGPQGENWLYYYRQPASGWQNMGPTQQRRLGTSKSAATAGPYPVAITQNMLAVSVLDAGSVWAFPHFGGVGLGGQVATLTPSDGAPLGRGLTMNSSIILATGGAQPSKAYIFNTPGRYKQPPASEIAQLSAASGFDNAVSISGSALLIGGKSAAYVYLQPSDTWHTTSTPDLTLQSGDPNQVEFASSVCLVGAFMVVGDPLANDRNAASTAPTAGAANEGAAYVFRLTR